MEENMNMECGCHKHGCRKGKLWASALLAAGVALGGFFPGYYYYQAKVNSNFVTVKGLAEMDVKADLAIWKLKFVVTGNSLQTTQQEISRQCNLIYAFLTKQGISAEQVTEDRVETNDLLANPYRSNNDMNFRFIVSQTLTVRSSDVDTIDKALRQNGELVAQGIIFDSQSYGSPVSYIFTGLNKIKPQMLEEATKNAAAAADEFAKSSGSKVGRIRRASQGVFSILPRDETDGMQTQFINKKVRVVSTVEYWLE